MKKILTACSLIFIVSAGCSSFPYPGQNQYRKSIEASSAGDRQFSGFYHNFEFKVTILIPETEKRVLKRKAEFYHWSPSQLEEKMAKSAAAEKTKCFLSFYTPNFNDDNLDKKTSIWKIYLSHQGQRYEGVAKKAKINLTEAKSLYPYHNRWATPYFIEFPVNPSEVELAGLEFEISGPLGRRKVTFQ